MSSLPANAVGNFNGVMMAADGETEAAFGTVSLDITAKGKISGKILEPDGSQWLFTAKNFAAQAAEGCFYFDLLAKNTKTRKQIALEAVVYNDDSVGGVVDAYPVSFEDDSPALDGEQVYSITAQQNRWKISQEDGGYQDHAVNYFTDVTGRAKYRMFYNGDAEVTVYGLQEGESLALKVEQSGKVTATLTTTDGNGAMYSPTCTTVLNPTMSPQEVMLSANAVLMFKDNAKKKFVGRFVSVTLEDIENPE